MNNVMLIWRELYEMGGKGCIRRLLAIDSTQATAIRYGRSLLHIAAGAGYSDEILLLLRHGADVNSRDDDGNTPLHKAAAASSPNSCRILLDHGALASVANNSGELPLDCAKKGDIQASREDYENTIAMLGLNK